jgi:hypothetical protein
MQNWNNVNSHKEKAKTEQFGPDSVPELNTRNLGTSLNFLSVLKRLRSPNGLGVTEI